MSDVNKLNGLSYEGYELVWMDDFDGDTLNREDWNVELHEPGWVNKELQEYVDSTDNIQVKDSNLYLIPIQTRKEDGTYYYTSGRVNTQGKHDFKYGLFEARLRVPKGKGYLPAERHPARFHGTGAFDVETGLPLSKKTKADYTDVFASVMNMSAKDNERLVAITAAMETGTGLKRFHNQYPERFFDVGIAEEHAVTFAAGIAARGLVPVVAIYSTFLQRAYDQILHDVCLQNLHVVFAVDRAGIVGSDGC